MPPTGAPGPAFSADAFSLTPDPARLYLSPDHGKALARLRHGLEARRGFVVMVGEVGTGKTTLAYTLLASLGPNVRTAYVANTRLPFEGLLRLALADFGVACEARERDDLLRTLRAFLAECATQGETAVLVVDEAQSLDDDTFESLRELEDLPVVLLGQPELDEKLKQPGLRAIADLVAVRVDLRPLDAEESRRYIAHRLDKAGGSLELFSPAAIRLILRHAGGVPRRMNVVCHNALLLAFTAKTPQVSDDMVREAIYELGGGALVRFEPRSRLDALRHLPWWRYRRQARWGSAGVAALAGAVVIVALWGRSAERPTATPGAPPVQVARVAPPITEPPPPAPAPPPTAAPPTAAAPTAPPPTAPPRTTPPPTAPPATTPPRTVPPPTTPPPTTPPPTAPPPTTPPPTIPPPAAAPPPLPTPPVAVASLPKAAPAPAVATAATGRGVSDAEVHALLDRYVRSWRTRDVRELRRIGQVADDGQAKALTKYFDTVRDLDVEVHVLEMSGSGDRRTVRFTRRDRFRDPAGREISKESPPIEKTIVRTPDGLKFAPRS